MIHKIFIGTVTALSLFAGSAIAEIKPIDLSPRAMNKLADFVCHSYQQGYAPRYVVNRLDSELKNYYQENVTEYDVSANSDQRLFNDISREGERKQRFLTIKQIANHAIENRCPD